MNWKWIATLAIFLLAGLGLFGCSKTNTTADKVAAIAFDYVDSQTKERIILYSEDKAVILNAMKFLGKVSKTKNLVNDAHSATSMQIFNIEGKNTQVVLSVADKKSFIQKFAYKMKPAIYAKGKVVGIKDSGKTSDLITFEVDVFPAYQKDVGEKTKVTVKTSRLFSNGTNAGNPAIGNIVELFITDRILETSPTQSKALKVNIVAEDSSEAVSELQQNQSNPLFIVFQQLWAQDEGINANASNIAIEMTGSDTEGNDVYGDFIKVMQSFCTANVYTLLSETPNELKQKGLIEKGYFKEGVLFSFDALEVSKTKITVEAHKWRSTFAAVGARYTLEKRDGQWSITKIEMQWHS